MKPASTVKSEAAEGGTGVACVKSILDVIAAQSAECQTLHAALRTNLRKQREELEALSRCQARLHRTQAQLFRAIAGALEPHTNKAVAEGTLAKPGIASCTSAFCVGLADLTGESLKLFSSALKRCAPQEAADAAAASPAGGAADNQENEPRRPPKADLSSAVAEPADSKPVKAESVDAPPDLDALNNVTSTLVHSLLSGTSWRRAVNLVTRARQERKEWPVDHLRNLVRRERVYHPALIGREDHLFMGVVESPSGGSVFRAEIIHEPLFEYYEVPVGANPADAVRTLFEWAHSRCGQLYEELPHCSKFAQAAPHWSGDFSVFKLAEDEDEEHPPLSVRYIPLVTGATAKPKSEFCEQRSKFFERWAAMAAANALWKAEIDAADECQSYQRTLKQAPYHQALYDTVDWMVQKCAALHAEKFAFKSPEDRFGVLLAKKRTRRASDPTEPKKRKQSVSSR